uniref:Uncharacterized protein n=1 Tax=Rhizophora mucronata TaxID=61149 RepID=A0A2P2IYR8_RHIMU
MCVRCFIELIIVFTFVFTGQLLLLICHVRFGAVKI